MSIRHMADVWRDPYFDGGDKSKLLVALAVADYANKDGRAWPAIESIAKKSRTSVRGAQEACRQLEKDGKLRIEYGKGQHGANVYFLLSTPQPLHPATIAPRNGAAEKAAEIPALGCTQSVRNLPHTHRSARIGREIPDWPAVKNLAVTLGLPEWKAQIWFDEMESCGWVDRQKRQIRKWRPMLNTIKTYWEADGRPSKPTNNGRHSKTSTTSSRNLGTCNEGLAEQYKGIGQ